MDLQQIMNKKFGAKELNDNNKIAFYLYRDRIGTLMIDLYVDRHVYLPMFDRHAKVKLDGIYFKTPMYNLKLTNNELYFKDADSNYELVYHLYEIDNV